MADLLIDQVAAQLHQARIKAKREHGPEYEPNISVYMEYDFWRQCMDQVNGAVSGVAFEFHHSAFGQSGVNKQTLMGSRVFKVVDAPMHPNYVFHVSN